MKNYILTIINFGILISAPILSIIWHYFNTQMPVSDSVSYIDSAYEIFQHYNNSSTLDFILSIFNERGWRPIIFPVFIFPSMIITNGDILNTVLITHFIFVSLSVFIIYKIFRIYTSKTLSALSSGIICLSGNIFFGGAGTTLFAEISFIPFILGTIYYLMKKDLFLTLRNTVFFSIFLTLSVLTRPVESIMFLLVPIINSAFFIQKDFISMKMAAQGFLSPIFAAWLLFASRLFPDLSDSILLDSPKSENIFILIFIVITIFLLMAFASIYFLKNNNVKTKNNYFVKSMAWCSFVVWFWFTPRFGSLYAWVYDTSVGKLASHYERNGDSIFKIVLDIIIANGIILTATLLFLVIFITCRKIYFLKFKNFYIDNFSKRRDLIYLLSIFFPVFFYFLTFQNSYRKIAPVVVILLIFITIYVIKNFKKKNFLYIIFTALFFMNFSSIYQTFNINKHWHIGESNFLSSFPKPKNIIDDPHNKVITFLKNNHKKYNISDTLLAITDTDEPVERYLLKFMCKVNSIKCSVSSPYEFNIKDTSHFDKYDAFFIVNPKFIPLEKTDEIIEKLKMSLHSKKTNLDYMEASGYELYAFYLHYLYSSNKLLDIDVKYTECIQINKNYKGCLFVK